MGGTIGLRALAQDEFVVRHVALFAIRLFDTNGFRGAIDRKNFMVDMRPDARTLPEFLRGHDDQFGTVVNFAGNKIGEAAVGEGDIRAALENVDFGVLINPAGFGGGGSASCHAPYNHNATRVFHKSDSAFSFTTRTAALGAVPGHFREQERQSTHSGEPGKQEAAPHHQRDNRKERVDGQRKSRASR